MANAFKCDRCGQTSISLLERTTYYFGGDLLRLLFDISKETVIDLCPNCNEDLVRDLRSWWHGLGAE